MEYNIQYNIGKVKYVLSYHSGIKFHNDGSKFFDVKCFKSKIKLNNFIKELLNKKEK